MKPRIETLPEKKFIGISIRMSFSDNKTMALGRSFMPRRKEIKNSIGSELYSIDVYAPSHFDNFDADNEFDKWLAVEVINFDYVPSGMKCMTTNGLYAVFLHKGPVSEGPNTFRYIFLEWLPNSNYLLDDRPHFGIMGEKYKHDDPNSEEELWIPVRLKY